MRSTASFKGHPLHPALIPFPFAFLYGALFFDLAGVVFGRESWWTTGMYLTIVGIIAAVVAAVPGVIDYFHTVPPDSSAKKRGTKHGLFNLTAVILFGIALAIRPASDLPPTLFVLVLEAVGAGLLAVGGWMGGTLVNRNLIGVDPRYARAGKWKEENVTAKPGEPVAVAQEDELEVDQMKLLHAGDRRIVLGRTGEKYVAFDDRCTHRGGSLAGGVMICGTVQCPWHGSQFDVCTGKVKAGPAEEPIRTYDIEVNESDVRLTLPKNRPDSREP